MLNERHEQMTESDREALARALRDHRAGGIVAPVLLLLVGIAGSVFCFRIARDPNGGPMVAVAVVLLVAGVAAAVIGFLMLAYQVMLRRAVKPACRALELAAQRGTVEVLDITIDRAWSVDYDEDAVPLILGRTGPDEYILVEHPAIDEPESNTRAPVHFTIRKVAAGETVTLATAVDNAAGTLTLSEDRADTEAYDAWALAARQCVPLSGADLPEPWRKIVARTDAR